MKAFVKKEESMKPVKQIVEELNEKMVTAGSEGKDEEVDRIMEMEFAKAGIRYIEIDKKDADVLVAFFKSQDVREEDYYIEPNEVDISSTFLNIRIAETPEA